MRVAFPHALNIGTDIIRHKRLLPTPASTRPDLFRLIRRILHPLEIQILTQRFPHWQGTTKSTPQASASPASQSQPLQDDRNSSLITYLAGRWAAKEAAKKAWGAHLLGFKDVRVEHDQHGATQIICQTFDTGTSSGIEQVGKVSISHDGDYAIAMVIASPLHPEIVAQLEARKVIIPRGDDRQGIERNDPEAKA